MFGSKRRAQKRAAGEAAERDRSEAELRSNLADLIEIAGGAAGDAGDWPLLLKSGERIVYGIKGAGLFEPRRLPGHWQGRSAGVSVPVADGIRLRFGKSAGTFVQGNETPTIIDTGDASVTTERVVFQGSKYTREWDYSKLIGIMHYADQARTAIQVSNRQKTSGIAYPGLAPELVRLRLTVALALFDGEADQTAQQLRDELAKLDSGKATPPEPAVSAPERASDDKPLEPTSVVEPPGTPRAVTQPGAAPTDESAAVPTLQPGQSQSPVPSMETRDSVASPESPPTLPLPTWAADPSGLHQSRYWNGATWTDLVADNGQESRDPLPDKQQ